MEILGDTKASLPDHLRDETRRSRARSAESGAAHAPVGSIVEILRDTRPDLPDILRGENR